MHSPSGEADADGAAFVLVPRDAALRGAALCRETALDVLGPIAAAGEFRCNPASQGAYGEDADALRGLAALLDGAPSAPEPASFERWLAATGRAENYAIGRDFTTDDLREAFEAGRPAGRTP